MSALCIQFGDAWTHPEAVHVPKEHVGDGREDVQHHEAQQHGQTDLGGVTTNRLEQELHQPDLHTSQHNRRRTMSTGRMPI